MVLLWACAACDGGQTIVDRAKGGTDAAQGDLAGFKPHDVATAADAFCEGRQDGAWCDVGTLITCVAGAAQGVLPCPGGCISTPGTLPDLCAVDTTKAFCEGHADGTVCESGELVTCAGGEASATTPCPLGCLAGACADPAGGGLCAAKGDGAFCVGSDLVTCAGGAVAAKAPCDLGCVPAPAGAPSACAQGGGEVCGAKGDGVWCAGDDLVACQGGVLQSEVTCLYGCVASPTGKGSVCGPGGAETFCAGKSNGPHCKGSSLVACKDGEVLYVSACPLGCVPGAIDICKSAEGQTACTGKANGPWCHDSFLATCQSGQVVGDVACPFGCQSGTPGVADQCAGSSFCADVPAKASPSPPTGACDAMDWGLEPDGFYLVSQFGTTNDPTTLGLTTSCGYLQKQYDAHGCVFDQQVNGCVAGDKTIPWVHGNVDYTYGTVMSAVGANMGGDVPFPQFFYVAGAQRFGCGATLRVSNPVTGKCVVVYAEDGGPGAKYEAAAYGGRRILDSSPAVIQYLEVQQYGWKDSDLLYVEWGKPGDTPGAKCTPCESTPAKAGSEAKKSPWSLAHMVPSCGKPVVAGCPADDGLYCGASVGLDAGTLYQCAGGSYSPQETCASGCQESPPGTNDACAAGKTATECPSGDGLYCGGSVGLDGNTLYYCSAGNFAPTQTCAEGCQVNPPGTSDACKGTSQPVNDGNLHLCEPFKPPLPVTCGFGCYGGHKGSDYSAANGTPVYAPVGGAVTKVVNTVAGQLCTPDFGNYVKIQSGDYEVILAHMSKDIQVGKGDTIAAGTHVGNVSNTGYTMALIGGSWVCGQGGGYHLHLEVRKNGVAVDAQNTPGIVWDCAGGTVTPGGFCGGKQSGLWCDGDTLVSCLNGQAVSSTPCPSTCVHMPVGTDDKCMEGGAACPAGNGAYCGASLGKDPGALYQCTDGSVVQLEVCQYGCQTMPAGTADACKSGGQACPAGNGAYCGATLGLDPSTLYLCTNGATSVIEVCPRGCLQNPPGTDDACKAAGATCPSGNGKYCGASLGKDANTLYNCTNGVTSVVEVCPSGCQQNPAGTEDACKAATATCPSGNGKYCGASLGKDANTLYQCTNGATSVVEVCANGCQQNPAGTEDACKAAAATCPSGDGKYCGGSVGKDGNTLYNCSGGSYSVVEVCQYGCETMPAGTSDQCKGAPASCPSGNGLYCGGSVGKDSNTLYNCKDGSFSVKESCQYGCQTMPAGTSDQCKSAPSSSCPSGNGLYCGGPVGKDSNTLYNCSNGNYTVKQVCPNGCYVAPPGVSDKCK